MDEVVRSEPIWADMYSAFRHVAVARVINPSVGKWWYVVGGDAGMEVLKNYKPTFVEVPKEMVFSEFRKLSMKNKEGGTSWTLNCMCGGIDTRERRALDQPRRRAGDRAIGARITSLVRV
jgi:hypothetical protein